MDQKIAWLHKVTEARWTPHILALMSPLALVVSVLWAVLSGNLDILSLHDWVLFFIFFIFIILLGSSVIVFMGIRVWQANRAFKDLMETLHKINHSYRDTLCEIFHEKLSKDFSSDDEYRTYIKDKERNIIETVCQKIAAFYTAVTHRPCVVTVKLIVREEDGKSYCSTYVRSERDSIRDKPNILKYELLTGRNTAFDTALVYRQENISRFYSANLEKDNKEYRNERDNYLFYYISSIVVPIRYYNSEKIGKPNCNDDIGFLCVDTKSIYRLNDQWHVALLASFADQMYNFFSLTRGKYGRK